MPWAGRRRVGIAAGGNGRLFWRERSVRRQIGTIRCGTAPLTGRGRNADHDLTAGTLPDAALAIVDPVKLHDYCLSPIHTRGRHKARVFQRALGLRQADAAWLGSAILAAVQTAPALCEGADLHGQRWRVDLALTHDDHAAIVRTLWLIGPTGEPPRLITCYVV